MLLENLRILKPKVARQIDHLHFPWQTGDNIHGLSVRQSQKDAIDVNQCFRFLRSSAEDQFGEVRTDFGELRSPICRHVHLP